MELVKKACAELGVEAFLADHWAAGGAGAADVAHAVVKICESGKASFKPLYPDDMPLWDKMKAIAQKIYGASDITADSKVRKQIKDYQEGGYGHYPVCVAKTQYSFSSRAVSVVRVPSLNSGETTKWRTSTPPCP